MASKRGKVTTLPEKALLDAIHLRKAIPFRDELELDVLNMDRLRQFAQSYALPTRRLALELVSVSKGV
jgi:hypothetical protein